MNPLYSRMFCANFVWVYSSDSVIKIFKILQYSSLWGLYPPLITGMSFHLIKRDHYYLCLVLGWIFISTNSNLSRRLKNEKFTMTTTTRRTSNDGGQRSFKQKFFTPDFGLSELKCIHHKKRGIHQNICSQVSFDCYRKNKVMAIIENTRYFLVVAIPQRPQLYLKIHMISFPYLFNLVYLRVHVWQCIDFCITFVDNKIDCCSLFRLFITQFYLLYSSCSFDNVLKLSGLVWQQKLVLWFLQSRSCIRCVLLAINKILHLWVVYENICKACLFWLTVICMRWLLLRWQRKLILHLNVLHTNNSLLKQTWQTWFYICT